MNRLQLGNLQSDLHHKGDALPRSLCIGLDVGSTTVKATVVDPDSLEVLWSRYERHHARQPQKVFEFLTQIALKFPYVPQNSTRIFITGSGSGPLAEPIGAKFVQEVNALTVAVEHLHPDCRSAIELGGQDAKIVFFKENKHTGEKQAQASMNDKCASGTGATIDKCMIKVGLSLSEVSKIHFDSARLHQVAAKCGVFAETDIVNLLKSSIPSEEIMCSLADAIVMQNLSVLTRGNTLLPKVALLGGPNTYLPFLQDCWRKRIPEIWKERGVEYPQDLPIEDAIFLPENSQYYAAYGAVLYGLHESEDTGVYKGADSLKSFITQGRTVALKSRAGPGLVDSTDELEEFAAKYEIPRFKPMVFPKGTHIRAYMGLDGGSTSSKAVLLDEEDRVIQKAYQLSKGNPIQDFKEISAYLQRVIGEQGATLEIAGFGATGYSADVLEKALRADVNIVETIAHMQGAVRFFGDVDVICDIGGQDIKVLFIQNGELKNFRLSNQCSAGNGMLLQAMADQFGVPIESFAEHAFRAELSPLFSYGCAVFLDSDRVTFQREGFTKEELMAGLVRVLPKNVWQYVVQIPRLAELGTRFVLQGGTQYNLAAVKAQVDYILERVPGAEIFIHPHPGEAGAIGAALEAKRVVKMQGKSSFVGLEQAIEIKYQTQNDETTRCNFCPNQCSRTFIDTQTPDGSKARYIAGFSCEKGTVEDTEVLCTLNKERQAWMRQHANLAWYEAHQLFRQEYNTAPLPADKSPIRDIQLRKGWFNSIKRISIIRGFERSSHEAQQRRKNIRIGMPRVLNLWTVAPFFKGYFNTLGIPARNLVFSDETTEKMFAEGGKYGAVDPCYPSKVVQAHIHNLLFYKYKKRPLDFLFFPIITHIPSFLDFVMDCACCPIVAGTPNVIRAAFTKEVDFFERAKIVYKDPALSFAEPNLLKKQMWNVWKDALGITEDENDFAVEQGFAAVKTYDEQLQNKGRQVLEEAQANRKMCILLLGRPYHLDPGLNHDVMKEFQMLGFPVLSIRSIPKDPGWLAPFFADDLNSGRIASVFDIRDVWPENFSTNSAQKIWVAKFAARHPNVAVLDLSSFKCGHDAPTYGIIDKIIATSGTSYAALHDLDANKPAGSIKIRIKTYAYSLKLREEQLQQNDASEHEKYYKQHVAHFLNSRL